MLNCAAKFNTQYTVRNDSSSDFLAKLQNKTMVPNVKCDIFLHRAPKHLVNEFNTLLSPDAIEFLVNLVLTFDNEITDLYNARLGRKYNLKCQQNIPRFAKSDVTERKWNVAAVPARLQNRHLDLGDVSPSDLDHFSAALRAEVQGVQVDFDDGHCPTWANQIFGLYNAYRMVHGELVDVPELTKAPILMMRPRAWNMIEENMSVNGKQVPGPIFDFAILMFHNARILFECDAGPCFYLSKLEGASEAKLWNKIFTWTEDKLQIPHGTIKACVLIENILSAFEMEHILYELKDHSLGLNCGIWDYAASIISKFGDSKSFLLPDRNKYVNMTKRFLKCYMDLVIQTCHKRNAHATGGMAADLLPVEKDRVYEFIVEKVSKSKLIEIQNGIDGFMVYDTKLVPHMNKLWREYGGMFHNQIRQYKGNFKISEMELLTLPKGGVTKSGLQHNIVIGILFIYNWFIGKGHFSYNGFVEDSATAEISRAQVWQWIRHAAELEDSNEIITRQLVYEYACEIFADLEKHYVNNVQLKTKLSIAFHIFLEIVNSREFPDFITTYLYNEHIFRYLHASL